MGFQRLCLAASLLAALFGLGFVAVPVEAARPYGITLADAGSVAVARHFGTAMLMYAAAVHALSVLQDAAARRRAAAALCAATSVGLVVALFATLGGGLNALGWSSVALYGVFTAAWWVHAR